MSNLCFLSATQQSQLIHDRQISILELVRAHLDRIELIDPHLNAFITICRSGAEKAAALADRELARGHDRGPLHGIPFGVKDVFHTAGVRTTSGTKVLHDFVPTEDASTISRLKEGGAILLGKLNLAPLAVAPTMGYNPDYGETNNPWSPGVISGGSSSGSAVAVAAGECAFSLGTDAGGSIRVPASVCGIVGFKPTFGLVSRFGVAVNSWTLDHAGPLTRTVADMMPIVTALARFDPRDPGWTQMGDSDYGTAQRPTMKGARIGVPHELVYQPTDQTVRHAFMNALRTLEDLGAEIVTVRWPSSEYCQALSSIIVPAEAAALFGTLVREHRSELDPQLRLRILSGLFASATEYINAQRVRTLVQREALHLFEDVDFLATPTVPLPACSQTAADVEVQGQRMSLLRAYTQFTRPFNLTGFPAITLPCGFSEAGLPIGLQLVAQPFNDLRLLRAAYTFEVVTSWHRRRPVVSPVPAGPSLSDG